MFVRHKTLFFFSFNSRSCTCHKYNKTTLQINARDQRMWQLTCPIVLAPCHLAPCHLALHYLDPCYHAPRHLTPRQLAPRHRHPPGLFSSPPAAGGRDQWTPSAPAGHC